MTKSIVKWLAVLAVCAVVLVGQVAMGMKAASEAVSDGARVWPTTIPGQRDRVDRDCVDFATRAEAQRFFREHRPARDPHELSVDGRRACTWFSYGGGD